jgi:hypothetical protein
VFDACLRFILFLSSTIFSNSLVLSSSDILVFSLILSSLAANSPVDSNAFLSASICCLKPSSLIFCNSLKSLPAFLAFNTAISVLSLIACC